MEFFLNYRYLSFGYIYSNNFILNFQRKQQVVLETVNLGEKLLKIGFATIEEIPKPLSDDNKYHQYYRLLQGAENVALRRKLGLKYYIKPTTQVIYALLENLSKLIIEGSRKLAYVPSRLQKVYAS